MSQWGWGAAASSTGDVPVQWWRWSHPDSFLYNLRPDRVAANIVGATEYIRSQKEYARGLGASSVTSPTRTVSSPRRQGRASAEPGKRGGPPQSTQGGGRARRKECPKGHYWSYKKKKCVKSKFR